MAWSFVRFLLFFFSILMTNTPINPSSIGVRQGWTRGEREGAKWNGQELGLGFLSVTWDWFGGLASLVLSAHLGK